MSDIKNKLWYTDEEIAEVEGKMGRPGFASTWSYAVISNLLSDRRNFITTIESQKEEIEKLTKLLQNSKGVATKPNYGGYIDACCEIQEGDK